MEDRPKIDQVRAVEYTAMRHEMQSITIARYTVLGLTITAIAAILGLVPGLPMEKAVIVAPVSVTAVLLPSIVMNLTLSRQFHRLSTFNAVFFLPPMFVQQAAFEIYKDKNPRFWGYVKPLAFAYICLLLGVTIAFLIVFWDWQMGIGMAVVFVLNVLPIKKLWDSGLTGKWRQRERQFWEKVRDEFHKCNDEK